jgi:beta-glucosidase
VKKVFFLLFICSTLSVIIAQEKFPYKDPNVAIEKRVEDLLNRMTLEEKVDLLGGTGIATKENKRLGIPELRMTDGPVGVRYDKSIAFPASIAMAATWNPELISRVGSGIGRETKGYARHVILGPCVNIARIPMGGRTFEGFGEDPFLTSRIAVGYIQGVQKEGVAATIKHFAANNQEYERFLVNTLVSRRALNEIYFPAFKAAIKEADVLCFMSAYNKVNGQYASENDYLLRDILRNEWGYKGLIMSDWGAVHSSVQTALGELDIEMPTGAFMNIDKLTSPIETGIVPVAKINEKVKNILTLMFKLGLFDKPIAIEDKSLVDSPENRKVAYEASLASIVLLKNDQNILPIPKDKIKTIAVIGPNADTARTGGGGSSYVTPINPVSILQGLKNKLHENVKIEFAQGMNFEEPVKPIDSQYLFTDQTGKMNGLNAEYFNNMDLTGTPVLQRVDKKLDFTWDTNGPGSGVNKEHYSVRWTGYIKVPKSGEYTLCVIGDDGIRFWLDDKSIMQAWYPHSAMTLTSAVKMEKDKYYKVRCEFFERAGGATAIFGWRTEKDELFKKAIDVAKKADYVILTICNTDKVETEGRDRDDLILPDGEEKLIEKVSEVNNNVVVLLTTGAPVLMDKWIKKVKGVVETWFPGNQGGDAIADVLLGNYNPSGKLPITFPHKWEDCSAYPTYKSFKERTFYSDDIYVGYRHFDKNNIEPLFPFGFGLSYTKFEYSNLNVAKNGNGYDVTFNLKNTGKVKGEEVAQVYVASTNLNIDKPVKELKGFTKVMLKPGESKNISVKLDKNSFAYFSEEISSWKDGQGLFKVLVGASSRDIKLNADLEIK